MRSFTITIVLLLITTGGLLAQEYKAGHAMTPDQLRWEAAPSVLPKGAQITVLSGDPNKVGPFTIRLRTPAGYKVPAHSHPTAERLTIISGEFLFGMGDKLDPEKVESLGSGGYVDLPANMNHYALTNTETVVQVDSEGPFAIKYVNSADDPSTSN